jgi:hypothetical protein
MGKVFETGPTEPQQIERIGSCLGTAIEQQLANSMLIETNDLKLGDRGLVAARPIDDGKINSQEQLATLHSARVPRVRPCW